MKKIFLFLVLISILNMVCATQSISDFNTNSPIPLDTKLVATGTYLDSDSNSSVYCKFITYDLSSGKVIERFTDELTFSEGSFYTDKLITEPKYFRDENVLSPDYKLTVTCGGASADTNFSISQRASFNNQFFGEIFFLKDNAEFLIIAGLVVLILVVGAGSLIYWVILRLQNKVH